MIKSKNKKQKGKFKHYGSQTSRDTLKRSGKYIPPEKPNLFKKIPTIYKPYYFLEKRVLEPVDAWISKQAFFTILGRLGNLALIVAVVSFVFGENVRRNNEVFAAWTTITHILHQYKKTKYFEVSNQFNALFPFPFTLYPHGTDKLHIRCKISVLQLLEINLEVAVA